MTVRARKTDHAVIRSAPARLSPVEIATRAKRSFRLDPGEIAEDRLRRGRGAVSNPHARYEPVEKERFEDGWDLVEDLAPLKTEVTIERPRVIITKNDSPDISFDQSINPY